MLDVKSLKGYFEMIWDFEKLKIKKVCVSFVLAKYPQQEEPIRGMMTLLMKTSTATMKKCLRMLCPCFVGMGVSIEFVLSHQIIF